ncbi:MAG: PilZ domain-containing protein [Planctomycetota bacterium]
MTEALGELSAFLRSHPCIAEAKLTVESEYFDEPRIAAWVVPEPAMFRVPATGRVQLIGIDGTEWAAAMCDASFDGLRVRLLDGQAAPEVGTNLQIHVESSAIGGMVGWMGQVSWQAGMELGIGFSPDSDQEQLRRFVEAFTCEASGAISSETEIGFRTRVALDVPVRVQFGSSEPRSLRSYDLSPTGVGLSDYEGPDPTGNPVRLSLGIPGLVEQKIHGIAVRRDGDRVGIALVPDEAQQSRIRDLVEAAIRMRVVTAPILSRWMREMQPDLPQPDAWFVVDALPED